MDFLTLRNILKSPFNRVKILETRLRWAVTANYVGSGWTALMNLAFVPLYIKFMGVEAYGLIGAYVALGSLLQVLDMGLSQTIQRKMVFFSVTPGSGDDAKNLTRTMELIFYIVSLLICAVVIMMSGFMSNYWLNPEKLSREELHSAFMIMGFVLALRWPISLYAGGLVGLGRQITLNSVIVLASTIRAVGSVIVLMWILPTIQAFFVFQGIANALETIVLRSCLWNAIPSSENFPRFDIGSLKGEWAFTTGMAGLGVLSIIHLNVDKIILAKILPLREFGYYSLAWTAVSMELRLIWPLGAAILPRLVELVAIRADDDLRALYRMGSQLMAIIVLPVTAILVVFSEPILVLWTNDLGVAERTATLISLLAIGACLYSFSSMPYLVQLAHGRTRFWFYLNLCSLAAVIPSLIMMGTMYGAIGAAFTWVALNSLYVILGSLGTLRLLTPEVMRAWSVYDVVLPTILVCCVAVVGNCIRPNEMSPHVTAVFLGGIAMAMTLAAAAPTPYFRLYVEKIVLNFKKAGRLS